MSTATLNAAEVDDLLGVELNVELVLDGRDEGHVAQRIPLVDLADT